MQFAPLAFYVAALCAYVLHFARRQPSVGRAATTLLVAGALAHTFVIGMQTMELGNIPIAGTTSVISTFVWLLALAYLYVEMTTDERAMGTFTMVLIVALQSLPAILPVKPAPSRPSCRPRSSACTCSRSCWPMRASRSPARLA